MLLPGKCFWCYHIRRDSRFPWPTCPQFDEYEDFCWYRFALFHLVVKNIILILIIFASASSYNHLWSYITCYSYNCFLVTFSIFLTILFTFSIKRLGIVLGGNYFFPFFIFKQLRESGWGGALFVIWMGKIALFVDQHISKNHLKLKMEIELPRH